LLPEKLVIFRKMLHLYRRLSLVPGELDAVDVSGAVADVRTAF
jgi:hypothetical protein